VSFHLEGDWSKGFIALLRVGAVLQGKREMGRCQGL